MFGTPPAEICVTVECKEIDLYFIRHGQTPDNAIRKWGSNPMTPLNDRGREEADEIYKVFKNTPIAVAFRSATVRTLETSEKVLEGRNIVAIETPKLDEMRVGELPDMFPEGIIKTFCEQTGYNTESFDKERFPLLWKKLEGKPITDANDCYLDPWFENADTFEGYKENALEFVRETIDNLQKQGRCSAIFFTHSTFLKVVLSESQGKAMSSFRPLTGSWVHIRADSNGKLNYVSSSKIEGKSAQNK